MDKVGDSPSADAADGDGHPVRDAGGNGLNGAEAMPRPGRARRFASRWVNASSTALVTGAVGIPVAFLLPALARQNPFSPGAATVPITAALCLITLLFVVALRWSGEVVAGAAAGLAAAWCALMLRSALYGTPFGFGGLAGDAGRTSASATRYTTTIASSDTLLPGLPSEYPPLFTWLIGRASVLLDVPAWRLVGDVEVLFMSAAVLLSFLLWRRLVGSWVALAISALTLITWSDPRKAFEVLTLVIFVPWALEVFARPPRARMHWLPAGLLGGFIVITYQAWVVYAALGLLALVVLAWRTEPDRWAYLRRLGLIAGVAFLASSWYVVPFIWGLATIGGKQISDLYLPVSLNEGLLPFTEGGPIGLLQLIGLVGLVWLWRSTWWARPLLLMIIGTYAYRLVSMIRFIATDHTGFLHYTIRLYGVLFTVAGVLVLTHVAPIVVRRLRLTPPRLAASAVLAVTLAWVATTFTFAWMPAGGSKYAAAAHLEPLPGGQYPAYAPDQERRAWFPVTPIRQAVEGALGPNPQAVTLSVDERLFAYLRWPAYAYTDRTAASTLSHWDERNAEIKRLAATTDPAAFADASGNTRFGPIDIFVLKKQGDEWAWRANRFSRAQFAPQYWTVVDDLPSDIVVAIRR